MYKIEKNIPMPAARQPKQSYPYREMEVGDSFFIEADAKRVNQIRTFASTKWRPATGFRFRVSAQPGGCRVWRTE
jgi:hypothetical protein